MVGRNAVRVRFDVQAVPQEVHIEIQLIDGEVFPGGLRVCAPAEIEE
jgi:hypothetical protein